MNRSASVVWLMSFLSVTSAGAATVSVSPTSSNVLLGSNVTVDIGIVGGMDLYAFQFDLAFEGSILNVSSVEESSFFASGGNFYPGAIDNLGGTITFIVNSLSGLSPGVSGSGRLASVSFDTVASGISAIQISNLLLLDSSLEEMSITAINQGEVNVVISDVPEPSTVVPLVILAFALARKAWKASGPVPCSEY